MSITESITVLLYGCHVMVVYLAYCKLHEPYIIRVPQMGYVYPKSEGIILFTAYNPKS
jgi:hypothetical protein